MAKAVPASRPSSESPSSSSNLSETNSPRDSTPNKKGKSSRKMLTENQKSSNHKEAENKRRNMIREQFTRLSHIVPGAEGRERSELVMLELTLEHFKRQAEEARVLVSEIEKYGGVVDENLKLKSDDWGGPNWKAKNLEEVNAAIARKAQNGGTTGSENGVGAKKGTDEDD